MLLFTLIFMLNIKSPVCILHLQEITGALWPPMVSGYHIGWHGCRQVSQNVPYYTGRIWALFSASELLKDGHPVLIIYVLLLRVPSERL